MRKILLFEPWHLGDVAVALSVIKPFKQGDYEFVLVCNKHWKGWALKTGMVNTVIDFVPPWTGRDRRDKYNPFNYKITEILKFKKQVVDYHPDCIIDLRGDIRARAFLKVLFGKKIKIISSSLDTKANVYRRGEVLQRELRMLSAKTDFVIEHRPIKRIVLFFGAADKNRRLPLKKTIELIVRLNEQNFFLNLILQSDEDVDRMEKMKKNLGLENVGLIRGDIGYIAEKIKESDLVITTDSGWLHVASFYNKPSIGLFGFDTMHTWLPPGAFCVTSNVIYRAKHRYKKKYRNLQPLSTLNIDKVMELLNP